MLTHSRRIAKRIADVAQHSVKGETYNGFLLRAVGFDPGTIQQKPCGAVLFPWTAAQPCMNGFRSVHGGSLSTLAESFTKIHMRAAAEEMFCLSSGATNGGGVIGTSVNFEIRFLSAVAENEKCTCLTRINQVLPQERLVFADFTFISEKSKEIMAVGTHILSVQESVAAAA